MFAAATLRDQAEVVAAAGEVATGTVLVVVDIPGRPRMPTLACLCSHPLPLATLTETEDMAAAEAAHTVEQGTAVEVVTRTAPLRRQQHTVAAGMRATMVVLAGTLVVPTHLHLARTAPLRRVMAVLLPGTELAATAAVVAAVVKHMAEPASAVADTMVTLTALGVVVDRLPDATSLALIVLLHVSVPVYLSTESNKLVRCGKYVTDIT